MKLPAWPAVAAALICLSCQWSLAVWNEGYFMVEQRYRQTNIGSIAPESATNTALRFTIRSTAPTQTAVITHTNAVGGVLTINPIADGTLIGAHHNKFFHFTNFGALTNFFNAGRYALTLTRTYSGGNTVTLRPNYNFDGSNKIPTQAPIISNGTWSNGVLVLPATTLHVEWQPWLSPLNSDSAISIEITQRGGGGAGGGIRSVYNAPITWDWLSPNSVYDCELQFMNVASKESLTDPQQGGGQEFRVVYATTTTFTIQTSGGSTGGGPVGEQPSELVILEAKYGGEGVFADVTSYVQQNIRNDAVSMTVGNHTLGGDPIGGVWKSLYVKYRNLSGTFEATVMEGDALRIPDTSHTPVTDNPSDTLLAEAVGYWSWFDGGIVSIRPDGAFGRGGAIDGTWRKIGDRSIRLVWYGGVFTEDLSLSADNNTLTGVNQIGTVVSATRTDADGTPNPIDQIGSGVTKRLLSTHGPFTPQINKDAQTGRVHIGWFAEDKLKYRVLSSTNLSNWSYFGGEMTGGGFDTSINFLPSNPSSFFKIERSGEHIIDAKYGAEATFADVTSFVAGLRESSPSGFTVGNHTLGGDPIFGKGKTLTVRISKYDGIYEYTAREGSFLDLRQ